VRTGLRDVLVLVVLLLAMVASAYFFIDAVREGDRRFPGGRLRARPWERPLYSPYLPTGPRTGVRRVRTNIQPRTYAENRPQNTPNYRKERRVTDKQHRRNWTPEQHDAHREELLRKRAAWERGREMQREGERVAGLRAELDAYRTSRQMAWMEHGGEPESSDRAWPGMMKDYLDVRQIEADADRAAKLEAAEAHYDL
jgi:hypothetical protein